MNTERSFKCRICGGEVTWEKGSSMGECIYCGSKQPIPSNLTAHTQDLYNDAFEYLKKIKHAGSVFLGRMSMIRLLWFMKI